MKIMRTAAAGCLASALAITMVASPADAAEKYKLGTKISGPGSNCNKYMAANTHVKVCWQPDGEKLYVYDGSADGRSAVGETDWSLTGCRNKYGKGTWVVCDYDFVEGHKTDMRGFTRDFEGLTNWVHDITGDVRIPT